MAYKETINGGKRRSGGLATRPGVGPVSRQGGNRPMGRIIRFLILLVILGIIGLIGYSYSGYLVPEQNQVTMPVDLNVD
jgi:hypothetical protein